MEILATADPSKSIFLITITARRNFYEQCGFQEVSSPSTTTTTTTTATDAKMLVSIPLSLKIEKLIGSPIAQLAAQDSLIIMKYSPTRKQ